MPTLSRASLESQLIDRVRNALTASDADGDGSVTRGERATLPDDVRPLADSTADYYLSGGAMSIDAYVTAYGDYARGALQTADANGNGELTQTEQGRLPQEIYASVLALRTATPPSTTPPTPPTTPPTTPSTPPSGTGVLGLDGTKGPSDISLRTVVSSGVNGPTGVAFDPRNGRLFVTNVRDDSTIIVQNPTGSSPTSRKLYDDSDHFLNNPMGIAFSPVYSELATAGESTNDYNRGGHGNMFTGPTLWPSTSAFTAKASCHLDMLHHSPNAMGITAGLEYPNDREYWVMNGEVGSIDRYFFGAPHAPGADDHSDGLTIRYGAGLKRKAGVPSGMALDGAGGTLFIADTGNGRIAKLDTSVDIRNATPISGFHDETPLYKTSNASIQSVTSASAGLVAPAGLALHEDHLIVADYGTGHIKVFTKDGELVGDLDTGLGAEAITGLAVGPNGKLFVADTKGARVLEITVL